MTTNPHAAPIQIDLAAALDTAARAEYAQRAAVARAAAEPGTEVPSYDDLPPGPRTHFAQALLPIVTALVPLVEGQVRDQLAAALGAQIDEAEALMVSDSYTSGLRRARNLVAPAE